MSIFSSLSPFRPKKEKQPKSSSESVYAESAKRLIESIETNSEKFSTMLTGKKKEA